MKNRAVQRLIKLEADSNGKVVVPDSIHLMSAGHWHTPWHGAFEMTPTDLADMVIHFEEGIGLVAESGKAPLNYGHDMGGKAAGWITRVYLDNNGTELWGDIEWTPAGRKALEDGEYRYISPEWNPRNFAWENPEQEGELVENVFTGAALTNIPLFKKLKPIMASIDAGGSDNDKNNGGDMPVLDEVRVKKPEELTEDEKTFLAEHQAELTDEERATFGLDEGGEGEGAGAGEGEGEGEGGEGDPAPAGKQASANPQGISASELAQLRADAQAGREALAMLAQSNAESFMASAVSTGRIKADQKDAGVKLLLASHGEQRQQLEAFINALPENTVITAGEIGSGEGEGASAMTQLFDKAKVLMASEDINITDALARVRAAEPELAKRFDEEQKGSK